MVIQTNNTSYKNFLILMDNIIGGLEYSIGVGAGAPKISLDEPLDVKVTSKGTEITASRAINIIGEKDFKAMVENTANPTLSNSELTEGIPLSIAISRVVDWSSTVEGHDYWSDIYWKLAHRPL